MRLALLLFVVLVVADAGSVSVARPLSSSLANFNGDAAEEKELMLSNRFPYSGRPGAFLDDKRAVPTGPNPLHNK
ncbi:hypothetical protein Nepgr_025567 [Nepenthes gracilis]|uniref:Uncharacterized protein n=1 Tax=Nepenthes gracilis TaxID=150966 RepID=A0AAD3T6M3_NEPGR|nr:hypothetical protein Nepgr_025567 [Nepenthes gracilis]